MLNATAETAVAAEKPSKKKLCRKIDIAACDISVIASTLIAMARNDEVDRSELSHSAELLGKEIRHRATKISGLAESLMAREEDHQATG